MIIYNHLTTDQMRRIIQSLKLFSFLAADEVDRSSREHLHILGYDTGEFLIQEGASDRALFLLLHGFASVVKEGAGIPMAQLEPGDFFGEVAFLTGRTRITNVIVHPPSMTAPPKNRKFVLDEMLLGEIFKKKKKTAVVLRLDGDILSTMEWPLRIRLKDTMIEQLSLRVEGMVAKVERMLGESPELEVDSELEALIQSGKGNPDELEAGRDAIIKHLVEFIDRLNQQLTETF
ncbi:MAG: cyclic nucleotide-binding domain-containing protein [Magnetococcales bacterium]|nr:cyclic nucleotide-binding domain-containing protein [Magnetococcales bacterium]